MEEQRALFMLWQDAYSLKHLLERPHLNEVAFKNTPLDRSAVCTQLASLVAHAQAVSPKTRATLPAIPWHLLKDLPDLTDPAAPFHMDESDLSTTWDIANTLANTCTRELTNDIRVIKARTYMDNVMSRSASQWPQPDMSKKAPEKDTALVKALSQAIASLHIESQEHPPYEALWLLTGEKTCVVVVEDTPQMNRSEAQKLAEALKNASGKEITLIPQTRIHPILWDDIISREVLLWEYPNRTRKHLAPSSVGHHHG